MKKNKNKVRFYELEKARFIIKDACGLDIAYAYEDLVFSEHGLFIIQFDEQSEKIMNCWFNKDCIETDQINLINSLVNTAKLNQIEITYKGKFEMIQKDNEEKIDIHFL